MKQILSNEKGSTLEFIDTPDGGFDAILKFAGQTAKYHFIVTTKEEISRKFAKEGFNMTLRYNTR